MKMGGGRSGPLKPIHAEPGGIGRNALQFRCDVRHFCSIWQGRPRKSILKRQVGTFDRYGQKPAVPLPLFKPSSK